MGLAQQSRTARQTGFDGNSFRRESGYVPGLKRDGKLYQWLWQFVNGRHWISIAVNKRGDAESNSSRIGLQVWFAWRRWIRGCRGFVRSGQAATAALFVR